MFKSDDDDVNLEEMEDMDLEDQIEALLDRVFGAVSYTDDEHFDDDAIFDEVTERIPA